ncbi:hypothetical protein NEMBOFW57_008137 [Staphylotrichum longicolle]|uniref:Uncharacterized protein n=1 Tax=Staphylotrichum longicolle TaxID=669026 RepID=A0AAD4HYN1_9PEZI|nr:hypothetical protein NEMBOFW57_008137 [Staphylotrichum longicolle]
MVAGKIPTDIVGARLATLIDVLVNVVEDKEPVAIVRSREPVQYVRHHSLEIFLAMQYSVPTPLRNLAFRYPSCIASKALPQPVLRSAIQPEDRAENGLVSSGEVGRQLCLPDPTKPVEDKYSSLGLSCATSREKALFELCGS